MRVLIVDDSKPMRMLLKYIIEAHSFTPFEAPDAEQALTVFNRQLEKGDPINLALVDWEMPGMDGLTLVQHLRSDRQFDPMKIMMVTTRNSLSDVMAAMKAGADDYLMKPIEEEMIDEKLRIMGMIA